MTDQDKGFSYQVFEVPPTDPHPRPSRAQAMAAVEELKLTAIESTWGGRHRLIAMRKAEKALVAIIEALTEEDES